MEITKLQIGQILRYTRDKDHVHAEVDGYTNYWHVTQAEGLKRPLLESGINPIAAITSAPGARRPAILISSSPHKIGSVDTPWHDLFDADNGRIRYFGDAKIPGEDPAQRKGNKALLIAHATHSSIEPAERANSTPILFFKRTAVGSARKGYLSFQGFGVIESVSRISQFDPRKNASFANYVYDFAVLGMAHENETFDWGWINARRSPDSTDAECLALAPQSWKRWLKGGSSSLARNRRHVSKLLVTKPKEQLPAAGSRFERILHQIYAHYETKKHHFELAPAERLPWLIGPYQQRGECNEGRIEGALHA